MSITELIETYNLPTSGVDISKRVIQRARLMTQKIAGFSLKKTRRSLVMSLRSQYYPATAAKDLKLASQLNEDILLGSLVLALVVGYAFIATASQAIYLFVRTAYDIADLTGTNMLILMLVVSGIMFTLGGWVNAFLTNMQSYALMEGVNRKQNRSLRLTVRKSLRHASRVAYAWLLLATVVFGPLFGASVVGAAYIRLASVSANSVISVLPWIVAVSLAWIIGASINYSLAPYVALFEPKLELGQTLKRSRQLLGRKGRFSLLLGFIALSVIFAVTYVICSLLEMFLKIDKWLTFFIASYLITLWANGIMVMLYRKRKLAKKY